MGQDDPQLREVDGDVVDEHRVRVLQPDAAAAGYAGPDPGLSGVEQRGHAELLDGVVQRVGHPVVRRETLDARVELETAYAVAGHQPARLAHPGPSLVRVDARERDEHVWVRRAALGDLLVADPRMPGGVLGVDGEDHRRHRRSR